MSGNKDKFIDRSPYILPAGLPLDNLGESAKTILKQYSEDDAYQALKLAANINEDEKKPKFKIEPYKNEVRKGIFTEIKPCLQPKIQTGYQILINELKETTYESHWNKPLGRTKDLVPGLPRGLNIAKTTFGTPTDKSITMKDLLNPPKTTYEVLTESQVGHELYKKSHSDYNIGEKMTRNYLSPAFDSTKRFGHKSGYDPTGIWAKCSTTWYENEPIVYTSKRQADFVNKTRPKIGEPLTPNNIAETLPEGFVYGTPTKTELYGVEELLRDSSCPPCEFKQDLKCWLRAFNKHCAYVRKRIGPDFNLNDLKQKLRYFDTDRNGTLPLDVFFQVCMCHRFRLERANLEPFLRYLCLVQGDRICYRRVIDLFDQNRPPVELEKLEDIPKTNQYYLSTSQAASCDYLFIDHTQCSPAGIPSLRFDMEYPMVPPDGCNIDLENLSLETNAEVLTNRSVYLNYGLSSRDFFFPRTQAVIRKLFENIGYKLSDEIFEKLWQMGVEQDKTGMVCVDTFDKLLQRYYGDKRTLVVDEATC